MADTKITALAAITTVDPAADVLPIVDISDTSMAASGTTKKITSNQILGAGGTATLASATITGAATVGTTLLVGTNATLTNGNVIIGTIGKGIDFSATASGSGTMTSELLADYEEGTWTIGLTFGGGSTGITTSANTGRYTKVGRKVTVIGYIGLTNKGSSTGAANITGLPFASPNTLDSFSAISMRIENISYVGTPQGLQLINTTKIELEKVSEAGASSALTDANFSNTSSIMLESTYFV